MEAPALMFGIGATRGGTTWLYQYLRSHPQCHLRPVKEAHWFNTLERDQSARRIASLTRVHDRFAARAARNPGDVDARSGVDAARRLAQLFAQKPPSDAAYVAWLDEGSDGQTRLVGDITPAYATLKAATFRRMAGLRPIVRFVYLLRDPVARLWSNVRQSVGRAGSDPATLDARARAHLEGWLDGGKPGLQARADYRQTLTRLDRAIAPENLLVLFHETLFSAGTIDRLTAFLGLDPFPAPLQQRVHASQPLPLDQGALMRIRDRLAPQYDYIRDRFGAEVPPQWDAHTAEVMP